MKKTINKVLEGDLKISPQVTFDFKQKLIFVGVGFADEMYPCQASFEEMFAGDTPEQKKAFVDKIRKAERIAINHSIDPDIHLKDEDIELNI